MQIAENKYIKLSKLILSELSKKEKEVCWVPRPDGQLKCKQVKESQKINNFYHYLRAMLIYGVPYLTANPAHGPEFLQYISTILDADLKYSWFTIYKYDIAFRRFPKNYLAHSWAASVGTLKSNLQASHNLKQECSCFGNSQHFNHGKQDFATDNFIPICKNFKKGTCFKRGCKYRHVCKHCKHPGHNIITSKKFTNTNYGSRETTTLVAVTTMVITTIMHTKRCQLVPSACQLCKHAKCIPLLLYQRLCNSIHCR